MLATTIITIISFVQDQKYTRQAIIKALAHVGMVESLYMKLSKPLGKILFNPYTMPFSRVWTTAHMSRAVYFVATTIITLMSLSPTKTSLHSPIHNKAIAPIASKSTRSVSPPPAQVAWSSGRTGPSSEPAPSLGPWSSAISKGVPIVGDIILRRPTYQNPRNNDSLAHIGPFKINSMKYGPLTDRWSISVGVCMHCEFCAHMLPGEPKDLLWTMAFRFLSWE